jgi:hypothetical protein
LFDTEEADGSADPKENSTTSASHAHRQAAPPLLFLFTSFSSFRFSVRSCFFACLFLAFWFHLWFGLNHVGKEGGEKDRRTHMLGI